MATLDALEQAKQSFETRGDLLMSMKVTTPTNEADIANTFTMLAKQGIKQDQPLGREIE